ncbi:adenylosuccinate synthetase [Candidatus Bathyarchaeota archaeon ex4484_135]|nr:MAG: adenylosuccinate synthetase [Candidatus Bathyarchaeota archaeon ex4484_135]
MPCTVVVCGFFGDTGKGKVISYLALEDDLDLAARGGVGPNAGHTVVFKGRKYIMRMLPSAFVNERCRLLIGPGVLVDPDVLLKEVEEVNARGRVGLDPNCAVIEEKHKQADRKGYLKEKIGTTGSGCGPCNADRALRTAKLARDEPKLKDFLTDVPLEVNKAIDEGKKVLLEGTQGTFLSLYHGTYPYVTSKDVTASAICSDVGVGPTKVDEVIVVFKSFVTRVGAGPLPGELSQEEAERRGWVEVASVTGRKRRVAPFNFDLARRAIMLNGATQVALTKIDVLFPECAGARDFNELSARAREFVLKIEKELGVPVTLIGTGPEAEEMVDRRYDLGLKD